MINVYACAALTVEEMAAMMHKYLGMEMIAQVWDRGTTRETRLTLAAIGGRNVAFWAHGKRFTMHINDVFGQGVTRVLEDDPA